MEHSSIDKELRRLEERRYGHIIPPAKPAPNVDAQTTMNALADRVNDESLSEAERATAFDELVSLQTQQCRDDRYSHVLSTRKDKK